MTISPTYVRELGEDVLLEGLERRCPIAEPLKMRVRVDPEELPCIA